MSDFPAYLPSGTEVSAKFKGAFCEAKVKKIHKSIKIGITAAGITGKVFLEDEAIPKMRVIKVGEKFDYVHEGQTVRAEIISVKDQTKYHVVFNDGDEKELRRTQLCPKSGKHYENNLDVMPLSHPEKASNSSARGTSDANRSHKKKKNDDESSNRRRRRNTSNDDDDDSSKEDDSDASSEEVQKTRNRRAAASAATVAIGEMDQSDELSDESSVESSEGMEYDYEEEEEMNKKEAQMEREKEEKKKKLIESKKEKGKTAAEKMKEKTDREKEKTKDKDGDRTKVALSDEIKRQYHLDNDSIALGKCVIIFEDAQSAIRIRDMITTSAAEMMENNRGKASVAVSTQASSFPQSAASTPRLPIPNQAYPYFYKRQWWPAVVVSDSAYLEFGKRSKGPGRTDVSVRRFSDGKYVIRDQSHVVPYAWMPMFSRKKLEEFRENRSDGSNAKGKLEFTVALDAAYLYNDSKKLPKSWNMKEIYGKMIEEVKSQKQNDSGSSKDSKKSDDKKTSGKNSSESDTSSEESEKEVSTEERDLFIAKLYKFHEDSASPINRVPVLGGKEIDMYLFHTLVQKYGGAKKTTAKNKWNKILQRLELHGCPGANSVTLRKSYARYLEPYCNFEAKLGWSFDGRAGDLASSSRVDRRLVRPGMLSDSEKKKKPRAEEKAQNPKSAHKEKDGDSEKQDVEKGAEVASDAVHFTRSRSVKSESPIVSSSNVTIHEGPRTRRSISIESAEQNRDVKNIEKIVKEPSKSADKKELKRDSSALKDKISGDDSEKSGDQESGSMSDGQKKLKVAKVEEISDYGDEGQNSASTKTEKGSRRYNKDKETEEEKNVTRSTIITRFYENQKIRIKPNVKEDYRARVLDFKQHEFSAIIDLLMQGDDPKRLPDATLQKVKELYQTTRIKVHYHGWNIRYDAWIPLNNVFVTEVDQLTSRIKFREQPRGKLVSDHKMALAEVCQFPEKDRSSQFEAILKCVKESCSKLSRAGYHSTPRVTEKAAAATLKTEKSQPSTSAAIGKTTAAVVSLPNRFSLPNKKLSTPMASLQALTDSAFSSALRTTSSGHQKFSLSTFMSHMQTNGDPNLTVGAVAAAAVGMEARNRGGRLQLSPPGGRAQKTLLHQVSSAAGFTALRNDARTETAKQKMAATSSSKTNPSFKGKQSSVPIVNVTPSQALSSSSSASTETPSRSASASSSVPSAQLVSILPPKPVQTTPSVVKKPLKIEGQKPSAVVKEKDSSRKARAAVKTAEAMMMNKVMEGIKENPDRMLEGLKFCAEQTQEAQERNMRESGVFAVSKNAEREAAAKREVERQLATTDPAVLLFKEVQREFIEKTGRGVFPSITNPFAVKPPSASSSKNSGIASTVPTTKVSSGTSGIASTAPPPKSRKGIFGIVSTVPPPESNSRTSDIASTVQPSKVSSGIYETPSTVSPPQPRKGIFGLASAVPPPEVNSGVSEIASTVPPPQSRKGILGIASTVPPSKVSSGIYDIPSTVSPPQPRKGIFGIVSTVPPPESTSGTSGITSTVLQSTPSSRTSGIAPIVPPTSSSGVSEIASTVQPPKSSSKTSGIAPTVPQSTPSSRTSTMAPTVPAPASNSKISAVAPTLLPSPAISGKAAIAPTVSPSAPSSKISGIVPTVKPSEPSGEISGIASTVPAPESSSEISAVATTHPPSASNSKLAEIASTVPTSSPSSKISGVAPTLPPSPLGSKIPAVASVLPQTPSITKVSATAPTIQLSAPSGDVSANAPTIPPTASSSGTFGIAPMAPVKHIAVPALDIKPPSETSTPVVEPKMKLMSSLDQAKHEPVQPTAAQISENKIASIDKTKGTAKKRAREVDTAKPVIPMKSSTPAKPATSSKPATSAKLVPSTKSATSAKPSSSLTKPTSSSNKPQTNVSTKIAQKTVKVVKGKTASPVKPKTQTTETVVPKIVKKKIIIKKKIVVKKAPEQQQQQQQSSRTTRNVKQIMDELLANQKPETFAQMKAKKQKEMEEDGSINDISSLKMKPLDYIIKKYEHDPPKLARVLDRRTDILREKFTTAKNKVTLGEKQRREHFEKKRLKDKKNDLQKAKQKSLADVPSTSTNPPKGFYDDDDDI